MTNVPSTLHCTSRHTNSPNPSTTRTVEVYQMINLIASLITLFAVYLLHEDAKHLTLWHRRLLYSLSLIFFGVTVAVLYVMIDMNTYKCIETTEPRHNDYFRELRE